MPEVWTGEVKARMNLSQIRTSELAKEMDKKYQRSRMCASTWVYNQLILEGWETVCTFIDGKRQAD